MKPQTLFRSGLVLAALVSGQLAGAETAEERDARMNWFRDARFGLFIHWGPYAVLAGDRNGQPVSSAGEWIMEYGKIPVSEYEKLVPQFNPVKFKAEEWVGLAKGAGMKYIVITSKHHDGFGLWRSQLTDWCIKSTPFQRDPLKELADACAKEGVKLCFYYSIMDWHHPDYSPRRAWNDVAKGEPDFDRYVGYMKGQLKELLTGYGPIGILWFDGEWESTWTHERGLNLYDYVRSLQPGIIVNNRVGKGRAGMSGMDSGAQRVGDYGTPEQEIPATGFGPGVDWESCMTMNDTWGYKKKDQNWKSSQRLIRDLIDCASKGGNYLLNVGPTEEGLIPAASVERLKEIGAWMRSNAEGIYGTTASPFKRLPWGRCTKKVSADEAILYLHVFDWPSDGKLEVPGLRNKIEWSKLLTGGKLAPAEAGTNSVILRVPPKPRDPISSTVVVKIKGQLKIEEPVIAQQADGSVVLPASEADLHGAQIRYESGGEREGLAHWTNPGDFVDWKFIVTKPGRFEVTAETAGIESAPFTVTIGDEQLNAAAGATGDYLKFTVSKLGILQVPAAGTVTLAVRPAADGWHPLNLKSIRLKLIEETH
jgi:alpha-L-fucosidase